MAEQRGAYGADERPETDWLSVHVFYHDHLDPLLASGVVPLTEELRVNGLGDEFFYLRYWDGGQHLRFRVRAADGAYDTVAALVERRFGEFLRDRPATTEMDESAYERSAARIADWEGTRGHSRLRRNNSLEFVPYRRERHRYGYGAAVTAVERHFVESSRLALDLVAGGLDADTRFTAGYSMLVLSWLAAAHAQPRSTVAAESDTGTPFDPGLDVENVDELWERQRDTLCALTRRLRETATRGGGSGHLTDWMDSTNRLARVLAAETEAGRFVPPTPDRREAATPASRRSVLPVLDICAHLFCNRIGLSLPDESYVRTLAGRATAQTEPGPQPGRDGETEGETYAVANDPRLLSRG